MNLLLIRDALNHGATRLRAAGIDNPRLEARLLLAHALGVSTESLLRDQDRQINPAQFDTLLNRRISHEPLAFITGHREFWSLDFSVSPATLIPRADSETVIEAAVAAFTEHGPPRWILDLGTGTGCLLLAALHEFPHAFGVGVDRSAAATSLAARNAAMLGMAERVATFCGDWGAALNRRFNLVLCNPPYIPTSEVTGLMPDVAEYEPEMALDGGEDGLGAYRQIIPDLPRLMAPDGVAVLELGKGQDKSVVQLAEATGFTSALRQDLTGIARALVLRRASP